MTYSVDSPALVVQQQTVSPTFLQRKQDAVENTGADAEHERQEPTPPNYVDCTRFIGTPEEHLELTQNEKIRPQRKTVLYDPREMWWRTPAYKSLISINRNLLLLLSLWDLMVVLTTRFWPTICGEAQSEWAFCNGEGETVFVEDLFLSTLGVGMFLLLAFRANQAYNRFWEARTQWGMVKNLCRDITRQIMYGVVGSTGGRRRAALFVVAFASTLKLHLREERNCEPCLGNILCFQDVANLEKVRCLRKHHELLINLMKREQQNRSIYCTYFVLYPIRTNLSLCLGLFQSVCFLSITGQCDATILYRLPFTLSSSASRKWQTSRASFPKHK